jgi:hypothetical protein
MIRPVCGNCRHSRIIDGFLNCYFGDHRPREQACSSWEWQGPGKRLKVTPGYWDKQIESVKNTLRDKAAKRRTE